MYITPFTLFAIVWLIFSVSLFFLSRWRKIRRGNMFNSFAFGSNTSCTILFLSIVSPVSFRTEYAGFYEQQLFPRGGAPTPSRGASAPRGWEASPFHFNTCLKDEPLAAKTALCTMSAESRTPPPDFFSLSHRLKKKRCSSENTFTS